jgi:uncharacterized membrane protein
MAFCSKCGVQLDTGAAFCKSCGATTGASPGSPGSPPPAGSGPMASNVAGVLAYIVGFITGIIFLAIEPYKRDTFVRFHAFQSIFLSVACILCAIGWAILSGILFAVSLGFLWHFVFLAWLLIRLGFFLLWLFMMYKAYNNERYMLPIIGPLAAKQAG